MHSNTVDADMLFVSWLKNVPHWDIFKTTPNQYFFMYGVFQMPQDEQGRVSALKSITKYFTSKHDTEKVPPLQKMFTCVYQRDKEYL